MHTRISPAKACWRVLRAFPCNHAGAEISAAHVAEFFRRHGYPVSDIVAGVHHAVSSGWIVHTDLKSLKLTSQGVEAIGVAGARAPLLGRTLS